MGTAADPWLDKVADKLDTLLEKVSAMEGKLEGLPNRVQVLETSATRIDTTLTALVGTNTRHELRTDKLEERLRTAEDQLTSLKGERKGINWMLELMKVGGAGGLGAGLMRMMSGTS